MDTPEGDFRSTAMEALCRVKRSLVGGGLGEGEARSMRRTEAPLSARRRPAKGPIDLSVNCFRRVECGVCHQELGLRIRGLAGR